MQQRFMARQSLGRIVLQQSMHEADEIRILRMQQLSDVGDANQLSLIVQHGCSRSGRTTGRKGCRRLRSLVLLRLREMHLEESASHKRGRVCRTQDTLHALEQLRVVQRGKHRLAGR